MPGRYLTAEEMLELVSQASQPAIAQYGIKDTESFIRALVQVSFAECGTTDAQGWPVWDTQSVHDNGQGFGCFALHNQGYAGNLTREQRLDPATNAGAAAMKLAAVWRDGEDIDQNLARMTGPQGQNPAEPQALLRNAQAAARFLGGVAGGIASVAGQAGAGGFQEVAPTAGQGVDPQEVISWWATFFQDEPGYTAMQKAEDLFYDDPFKAISTWREMTGEGEAAPTAREEAATALDWALANRIIAQDGGKTYQDLRQRMLDQFEEKKWTAEQAISEFNAWMRAAEEATKRGEKVYGEEMKRKAWTTPTEHYPGTEPGGISEKMYERYGLEYKPSPGISVETLPNQEQMYGRLHQNMGVSQQAPATQGGWSGQGTGLNAAMDFLNRMNLRPGVRQGAGI